MALATSFYQSAIPRGLYRHYKNKLYEVFGTVTHSESEDVLVLYAPVDQVEGSARLWVRPLAMFIEMVETPEGDVPRFALVGGDTEA
jgi:hypothetical protein